MSVLRSRKAVREAEGRVPCVCVSGLAGIETQAAERQDTPTPGTPAPKRKCL